MSDSTMMLQSKLAEAEARAEKAEAENATLHKKLHDVRNECQAVMDENLKQLLAKLDEAKAEIKRKDEALAFYADWDNHVLLFVETDKGRRARAALGGGEFKPSGGPGLTTEQEAPDEP